jgi:hypothetical protein
MLRHYLLVLGILLTHIALGQSPTSRDFVVLAHGDTLFGKVTDRKEGFNTQLYAKVQWASTRGKRRRFAPSQITAYQAQGHLYHSLWWQKSRAGLQEMYHTKEGQGKRQFLRVIVEGPLTLYHLEWVDPDSGTIEFVELFRKQADSQLVRASQGVLGLKKQRLVIYFTDTPEIAEKITSGELRSAREVAEAFNKRTAAK